MGTSREPAGGTDEPPRVVALGLGVGASTLARLGVQRIAGRFLIGDLEIVPSTHMTVTLSDVASFGRSRPDDSGGDGEAVAAAVPHGLFEGVDHLVRVTPDLGAELAVLGARGITVRRTASRHGRHQAFCWLGTPTGRVILEVVEDVRLNASAWWGTTLTSTDLAAVARRWGLPTDAIAPALQTGRAILVHPGIEEPGATPARLAVMSPHVGRRRGPAERGARGDAEGSGFTQRTDKSNGLA